MNIALLIFYIMSAINLLYDANQHGKPRSNVNFWISLLGRIIFFTLLWWATGWELI